ncbi:MAG: molybdenum cofactor guanylyltransferase, partial [Myxococcota bacterium]
MAEQTVHGFVLAGGASSRMGRDKSRIPIDGVCLAERVGAALVAGGCAPVSLVVKDPSFPAVFLPLLVEQDPGHHPLFGVAEGLSAASGPFALFAPCDLVGLNAKAVRTLLARGGPCRARGQPLLCVLPVAWAADARRLARSGGSARALVRSLPAIAIPEAALLNANTPDELAHALATIDLHREVPMTRIVLIADEPSSTLRRCGDALKHALPDAQVSFAPDDSATIRSLLGSPVTILCGGDALQPPESALLILDGVETRSFPGFAQMLRQRLYPTVGATSVLLEAYAEGVDSRAVIILPASEAACAIAGPVLDEILGTMLQILRGEPIEVLPERDAELDGHEVIDVEEVEVIPPAANEEPMEGGVHVGAIGGGAAREPTPEAERSARWQMALEAMGVTLDRERWVSIPPGIEGIAPLREILQRAGERAGATLSDGRVVGVYGFPDLRRPGSRVLMVTETRGVLEVAALHRHPQKTVIVGRNTMLRVGELEEEAVRRTGQPTPYGGLWFAAESEAVYVKRDGRVYRWD